MEFIDGNIAAQKMVEMFICVLIIIAVKHYLSHKIAMEDNKMRRLSEIEFEIDTVQREMARMLIQQSDIDNKLQALDRRRAFLEKEKEAVNV